MAYCDLDALIDVFEERNKTTCNGTLTCLQVLRILKKSATADVVPKSAFEALEKEVERLKHILDSYALQYGTVKDQQKVIDQAKAEVAQEIFAEIERCRVVGANGVCGYLIYDIVDLKKKYTEGNT